MTTIEKRHGRINDVEHGLASSRFTVTLRAQLRLLCVIKSCALRH